MFGLALYGTAHCHLCEAAESVLRATGVVAEKIDIMETPALLARYGERIPVLRRRDTQAELSWPFDASAVRLFCAEA
ncbi:MAG: glutaredoxin family protein [Gallionella sp.]|jgi:hypothetical protein|nr:glutaredoxin family protein [Gallionella sp.]